MQRNRAAGTTRPIRAATCITGLEVGGAERVLAELLVHKPEDIDIKVFTLIDGGLIQEQIESMGIEVTGLHMSRGRPSLNAFLRLWSGLLRFRPDVVHTWMYHADLMGGLAARLTGAPRVIWHLHNCDLSPDRTRAMTRRVAGLNARLSGWVPDVILSCSEEGAKAHRKLGYREEKLLVVPNGVDAAEFAPAPQARASVRDEFGVPVGAALIGLIARFDPQKNHRGFFDAAKRFFEEGGDAYFLLAGAGVTPDDRQLGSWRAATGRPERILLAGLRSDVPRLMAALDIATSSSLGEASPLVLTEAMASGVPCVATDVGDCRILIADTGSIVPPDDADALARAWRLLLDMPDDKRQALGERARQRVLDNYTIERFAERIWTLYRGDR